MHLQHLNNRKVILTLEHWTILIVFSFVVLVLSLVFTIEQNNLENLSLEFPKNMTKPPLI